MTGTERDRFDAAAEFAKGLGRHLLMDGDRYALVPEGYLHTFRTFGDLVGWMSTKAEESGMPPLVFNDGLTEFPAIDDEDEDQE